VGELDRLLATSRYGDLLREGASAVIVGPPNAGKSSLLNALLGRPRAIVSPEPGTTRDFIEERFLVGPYSIQITDTAGLRTDATNAIEMEGIARTHEKMANADLLLVVIDSTIAPPALDAKWIQTASDAHTLVIENKTDLSDSVDRQTFLEKCTHVRLSLKNGEGLEGLRFELVRMLEQNYVAPSEGLVLTSARHTDALQRTRTALLAAIEKLDTQQSTELLASDLRQALEALGEIPGQHSADGSINHAYDAMLDQLFAKFCIGK
jgi:tRNA modification GTPase